VRESINQVQIDLSTGESDNPNAGTVSLAQLTHRVPNSALKLYNSAVKAIRKRDNDDAIDLMEKAVAIDPRFVEAQENLGRLYIQTDGLGSGAQDKPAIGDCICGVECRVHLVEPLLRGRGFRAPQSRSESGQSGRPLLPRDQLGGAGQGCRRSHPELQEVFGQFPDARIKAAEILARRKEFSAATEELQDYLNSGTPEKRNEVTTWLQDLKKAKNGPTASR
jgi:hypothetical protein